MKRSYAMGWRRDLPDFRDFTPDHGDIAPLFNDAKPIFKDTGARLKPSGAKNAPRGDLPGVCDLRQWCSPIEDQGNLGSCTANAGVGLIEYYERRVLGQHLDASRLFLYKVTRNLLGWTGDTGAYLRTTMKAMALFGAPPARYLPYETAKFDEEPQAFHYAFAQSYQSLRYFRLDQPEMSPQQILDRVKGFLAAGYPSMFGFSVYNFGNNQGEFIFPEPGDSVQGGHAVMAVGYDDQRQIGAHQGALRVRNSWGTEWGDEGYGWLPYEYLIKGLAVDFWSLFKLEYTDPTRFS